MKRIELFLVVFFVALSAACATPKFQVRDDNLFKRLPAENKKISVVVVGFYHDNEKIDGRETIKGEKDPEYVELVMFLENEIKKQLSENGFITVNKKDDDAALLQMRVYGLQQNLYALFINHIVAVIADVYYYNEKLLLHYNGGTFYNVFHPIEKMLKQTIVPDLVNQLDLVLKK